MSLTNPPSGPGSGSAGVVGGSVRTHQSLKRGVQAAFDGTYLEHLFSALCVPATYFASLLVPRAAILVPCVLYAPLIPRDPCFLSKERKKGN